MLASSIGFVKATRIEHKLSWRRRRPMIKPDFSRSTRGRLAAPGSFADFVDGRRSAAYGRSHGFSDGALNELVVVGPRYGAIRAWFDQLNQALIK
jgi:hypothetical protein